MKDIIQPLKGTRDFYPDDMARRNRLYQLIRKVSESYGYQEFEGPYLEKISLYAAKSGEELVNQQSFVFPDRGGEMITLRPELTPTLARMVAQKQKELVFPLRWWSFGPFWRYERPQKGRTREFFQWNIDLIGVSRPETDAEMISIAADFLKTAGLTPEQAKVLVNDRKLMNSELLRIGISQELLPKALKAIDRRKKLKEDAWDAFVIELGFTKFDLDNIKNLLGDVDLWKKSETLTKTFEIISTNGLSEYIKHDPNIIRGLDYYTGTVFEAFDASEEGRAILGGGHYDNLVAAVGGSPLPGVGFAMGDVVIDQVLDKYGYLKGSPKNSTLLMTVFDADHLQNAYLLAAELRKQGLNIACYPEVAKLDKQFKYADRMGIRYALIQGPDEEKEGKVALKDLTNRKQVVLDKNALISELKRRLDL